MKSKVPAYVSFDKKVLRFFAYFQEAVAESSVSVVVRGEGRRGEGRGEEGRGGGEKPEISM